LWTRRRFARDTACPQRHLPFWLVRFRFRFRFRAASGSARAEGLKPGGVQILLLFAVVFLGFFLYITRCPCGPPPTHLPLYPLLLLLLRGACRAWADDRGAGRWPRGAWRASDYTNGTHTPMHFEVLIFFCTIFQRFFAVVLITHDDDFNY